MKRASILDMPEDLLEEDQPNPPNPPSEPTLDRLVTEVTNTLGITSQELGHWAKEAVVPEEVLKLILRTSLRLKLNPVLGQIDWELNLDGSYEVYIPIDGWIAMIHREPSFKGLTFSQATEIEEGIPLWMECSIYRADLIQPMTVGNTTQNSKPIIPSGCRCPGECCDTKPCNSAQDWRLGLVCRN